MIPIVYTLTAGVQQRMLCWGEITLGQQLLFCALGLGGRGGQGQAGADLSKGELVTRADARALGQTHHSPIQTHDEIRRSA